MAGVGWIKKLVSGVWISTRGLGFKDVGHFFLMGLDFDKDAGRRPPLGRRP